MTTLQTLEHTIIEAIKEKEMQVNKLEYVSNPVNQNPNRFNTEKAIKECKRRIKIATMKYDMCLAKHTELEKKEREMNYYGS